MIIKRKYLYKIIYILLCIIVFILGMNVFALNVPYWGYNSEQPIRGNIYSLGANFSKTDISIGGFADNDRYYIWNSSENVSSYIGTQGVALQVVTPTFKTDMYYNVNMYVCSRVSYTTNAEFTWHTHNADILASNQAEAIYNTWKGLSATPYNDGYNQQWGHCAVHSAIIIPKANGMFLDLRIRHTTGQSSADNLAIIGYDVTPLARTDILTRSDVENIVRNSGLATATDVDEVKQSIEVMKEEITNEQKITNEKLDKIDNSINNNEVDVPDELEDVNGAMASNGTITQLITLPITLYTNILNNINGTCNSFNLGNLYGHDLTISCIRPQEYFGSNLWGVIDTLFTGFFIFVISKKMIKVFDNFSSLKEGDILD